LSWRIEYQRTTMPKLILIKHAAPLVEPLVPSADWSLSDAGRAACDLLAQRVAPHAPRRIISSTEPKATETAERLSRALDLPYAMAAGLHEHDRSNVPHLRSAEFISLVEVFFRRPKELVLGNETALDALDRFADAVERLIPGDEPLAIVAHGTVISLLLEDRCGLDPFTTWRAMGLPSFVALEASGDMWKVLERVDRL
jgi:broad specificity phosphatase PhoE